MAAVARRWLKTGAGDVRAQKVCYIKEARAVHHHVVSGLPGRFDQRQLVVRRGLFLIEYELKRPHRKGASSLSLQTRM